jgi:FAD/FMN-containing dehydrogenase
VTRVAQLIDGSASALRAAFDGEVIGPGDEGYDGARRVWNGDVDRRPSVIARCASAQQVAAAVRFGVERRLEISVRGGGHNFGGAAVAHEGLMIDLSPLHEVAVDAATRSAVCGGGTTWAEMDAATQAHGLATVGGTISHTGVGGLTLGGGIGWLTGKMGLSIDNLLECELVTADGSILRVSTDHHPDLFWALRGGGGNFGVVTRFRFRLEEVGPLVNVGIFFWEAARGGEGLRFCRDLVDGLPGDMGVVLAGMNAPPAPFVPERFQLQPGYALVVVGFGSAEQHARATRPVLDDGDPSFHLLTPMPYADLQHLLDETAPWGIHAYEKALYLDRLGDPVIDAISEHFPRKSSPMSIMPVFWLRGAYSHVAQDATAFGGSRRAGLSLSIGAVAPTTELLEPDRAWARAFWDALAPFASRSAGAYVNFMSEYEEHRVRATYGAATYGRLARIKAAYDPGNVFHLNMNITPA